MARVKIKKLPKALSGLEIKMQPGLYGTNGNRQFTLSTQVNSQKFAQQPTEVRNTLQPVPRNEANLEAEKGETAVVNIDGMPAHFKIGGKRHSQGGTPLNLPDNSFIFSDTAKMKIKDPIILAQFGMSMKKGGYTPAEIAKKYDINKYRQVLADPNTEDVERKTAELMISNYNMKLAKLGLAQESMKGFPQGIPVMAMPYVMANNVNPADYFPTEAQEDEPDADTGEARYGGNMIAQFPTKAHGGMHFTGYPYYQVGGNNMSSVPRFDPALIAQQAAAENLAAQQQGTMTAGSAPQTLTGTASYNVPLQVNPKDLPYTEPDMFTKALKGVGAIMEAPQRAMMYAGTSMFGDEHYKVINPKTGESEWVTKPVANIKMKQGYTPTGEKKTGFYEMPSETLERRYPDASPALKFASDVFADPLLPVAAWKSVGRIATKQISKPITKVIYKTNGTVSKAEAIKNLGPKVSPRKKEIASKVYDKVMDAYKKNPSVDEAKLLKIAAPTAHNAAIAHDATKAAEEAARIAEYAYVYGIEKAKEVYDKASPIIKKIAKGTKKVAEKVYNAVDDPFLGPTVKMAGKNIITSGGKTMFVDEAKKETKYYKNLAQEEKERANKEKQRADSLATEIKKKNNYIPAGVGPKGEALYTDPSKPGKVFQGSWGTFTEYPAKKDSLLIKEGPKKDAAEVTPVQGDW
jgi:hypothetical protein